MANTIQKKIKFSKGQVSPELIERTDLSFYDSSAQKMKNVISTIYGGVRSRKGTDFIDYITDMNENQPDSITTDVFGATTHFTDLEENVSNVIGNNRLIGKFDYGVHTGAYRIDIKSIRAVPFKIEYTTAGTRTDHIESGRYRLDMVGAGGGGKSVPMGGNIIYNYSGGSGAYVNGTVDLEVDDYEIVVGGSAANTDGGDTTFNGNIAGGGKKSDGAGGVATTTLNYVNGNKGGFGNTRTVYGGASVYEGYGRGGDCFGTKVGGDGYFKIELVEPSFKIVVYGSNDDSTWDVLSTKNISTTAYDISVVADSWYRYIKIEIDSNELITSKVAFNYIRNLDVTSQTGFPIKMHKFIYNNYDKYLLVFTPEIIQIYKDDALVQIVTATGLLSDYVIDAKVAYKDDTVIVTHPEMPPKQLQRQSNGTWVWSNFTIKNTPVYAFEGENAPVTKTTSITPSAVEGTVKITAGSNIFDSSWVGQIIDGNGGRVRITEYTSGTVVKGVTIIPFYTTDAITSWEYIGGYEAVWSAQRGYPTTCLFAQQRLWFGGSKSLPSHIWASRLDDYNNFRNSGNYDNDSIDITMLTNNKIMNMVEQRGIHILTSGDEWTIQEGTYTPDKISITKNTNNGSTNVTPAIVSGAVLFVEKNGKSLLSYIYNYDQASFLTENISLFSNLIKHPVSFDTEINSSKDKSDFIYLVLEDGTMLCGCLLLDQNITSISEYKTDGTIKDVCCLLDNVYMIVSRNGYMCIEKITDSITDCTRKEYVTVNNITGLNRYKGNYVYVYSDKKCYGRYYVYEDEIVLDEVPNELCKIGLSYDYYLESNPIAINGKTTSIKKRISKATITCKDTDRLEFNGQKKYQKGDVFDFYSCTKYGNDVRFKVQGEFYPMEILSIMLNINYEG